METERITHEAVMRAVAEFDQLGREAFLAQYGFGAARDYFLHVGGRPYDSKAIVGVAHKFLPSGKPLRNEQFSGGIGDAAGKLKGLGFDVRKARSSQDWTWDEHVLALDLYLTLRQSKFSHSHPKITEASELLNRLAERRGWVRGPTFRNVNGVYMKLMNFRRLDPVFTAEGKVGLRSGNQKEAEVWARYSGDRTGLAAAAAVIRATIAGPELDLDSEDDEYGSEEGGIIIRLHKIRERDPKLAQRKRDQVLAARGALRCEVCEFDFGTRYPTRGDGFIEVHHTKPVGSLLKPTRPKLSDLAVVCSNCHRMLHRGGLLSLEELRSILG